MRRLRPVLAVPLCALAAHALLYRSVAPDDALHGYLAWYEPLVLALSLAAAGAVALLGLRAAVGRASLSLPGLTLPRLAPASLALVVLQESLEHGALPSPARLAQIALCVCAAAAVLALADRAVRRVALRAAPPGCARPARALPFPRSVRLVPSRPIARHRALRAPPVLA
jgi:hypothetical protein